MSIATAEEVPEVLGGAPAQKGRWRMEILRFEGGRDTSVLPKSMYMDSRMDTAKKSEQKQGRKICQGKSLPSASIRLGHNSFKSTTNPNQPLPELIQTLTPFRLISRLGGIGTAAAMPT